MSNDLTQMTQRSLDEQVIGNLNRLQEQGLEMPPGYSPQNALKSAFFELTNNSGGNLLQLAANNPETKTSISNALLDMVIQGLSPAKKQCYFIKYGNKVQLMRSYFGTMAVLDRVTGGAEITPVVVREGDVFEIAMDGPDLVVAKHETSFENLDNDIKAAYVVIKLANGKEVTTVMTKKQIDKSWSKAKTKNVQNDFPEEMAKRTVINRAAKYLINTSNDNDLFVQAAKDTLENEFERKDVTPEREEQAAVLEEKLFSNNKKAVDQENDNERITRVDDVPEQPDIEQAKPIEKEDLTKTAEQILEEPVQETLDVMAGYETNQKESEPDVSTIEEDDYPF
ncbi:recombinase RecT [Enterococcus faecalis]|uniref:recombinase RecT n=1 Tax=Enterococcus faecalis TaxID=1351 RepID=UPI00115AFFCF|nr:RecT family recombinase [Enterococcus faecalis]EGO2633292.1 recombinase RecT [Enterococcus faecalis]EGO8434181.1 RecT protein [Enterococcus faecalis]EHZ5379329.1 recombinase RecT [Enterococcus faecalis]EKK0953859.1 recombinase RecT [Enterococcus faecalis]HBD0700759.1 recombinase RecT [Enterococcus faecalis]